MKQNLLNDNKFKLSIILITCVILLQACAIKKEQCIGCDTETVWRLNIGAELKSSQDQYKQFFKDVGEAQRAGTLTDAQTAPLFSIGHDWRTAQESANAAYKAYIASPSDDQKQKVINLITAAEQIFLKLSTMKTNLMAGGTK